MSFLGQRGLDHLKEAMHKSGKRTPEKKHNTIRTGKVITALGIDYDNVDSNINKTYKEANIHLRSKYCVSMIKCSKQPVVGTICVYA